MLRGQVLDHLPVLGKTGRGSEADRGSRVFVRQTTEG